MNKKSKRTLTPKLRFPEFREGAEWKAKSLGEMCDRIVEKVGDTLLTPVSITAGKGFVSQVEKFGRDISGDQYKNYIWLRQGDFAYNKGNSKSYPQGCVRRLKEFDQAAAPSAFVSFRLRSGYVPEFFEGLFEKNTHGRQLIKFITSSARSDGLLNISPDEFFSVNLLIPQEPAEQQKIAECLSSLDGLIAAEARKLEALKAHKKGLMQQLFPQPGQSQPRLRFPEFRDKGEWELDDFDVLVEIIDGDRGVNYPKESDFSNYGYCLFLNAKNVTKNGFKFDEMQFITREKDEALRKGKLQRADVVLTTRGSVGQFAYFSERIPYNNMRINSGMVILRVKSQKIKSEYMYAFCKSERLGVHINDIAFGNAQQQLTVAGIKKFPLNYPAPDEQQKIADCLTALDTQIAAQVAKIEALQTHKRGLMQQLFPAPEEQ